MPPRFELTAPKGAPECLVVLIDDMGFGQPAAFGGPIKMPTLDRIANKGCATTVSTPLRSAVPAAPRAQRQQRAHRQFRRDCGQWHRFSWEYLCPPGRCHALAQITPDERLQYRGLWKEHETPGWEIIPTGPFDRWPTGSGFEEFYGFVGGDMNQWNPMIYHGTTKVN